jgi:cytochrome P450
MSAVLLTDAPLRSLSDLPSPRGLPVLGHVHLLKPGKIHLVFEQWLRELGPMLTFRLGGRTALVCRDAALLQQVLRDRPEGFRRRRNIEAVLREFGANGVFSVEGEAWRPQRQLVTKALAATNFRRFHPQLLAITDRLRRRWEGAARAGTVLDMCTELTRYTVDVTTTLAFGEDPNTIEASGDVIQQHLSRIFPALMSRTMAPFPYWRYLKLPRDRALDRSLAALHAHVHGLVARARARLAAEPGDGPRHLLEAMLVASREPDARIDDDTIVANVITLLLAGEDTTAHSLAWCMPYLAADPALQDRLSQRARDAFGAHDLPPDVETMRRLDAFEAVATEVARLRPVIPAFAFEPLADADVGGVRVPAGTAIFFMLRPDMVDAAHFGDPATFDPGRWQRDADRAGAAAAGCPHAAGAAHAHDPHAWVQFGAGPRVCPGRHLATQEIRLVLAMLTRHFRLQLACEPGELEEVMDFTMHPARMPVRLALRA